VQAIGVEQAGEVLAETRERTLGLVGELSDETLETVHSTLLSPLVWDLAHIAAFEDLWTSRTFDRAPLRPELLATYDADETPRALRGSLEMLGPDAAREYMVAVTARTLELVDAAGGIDRDRLELIVRHEQQHNETMLQAFQLAHLSIPFAPPARDGAGPQLSAGSDFIELHGGTVSIGAGPARGFAYDNERPRHGASLPPFQIARAPVTNAEWRAFIEGGGYQQQEWWSSDGWAWRQQEQAERPLAWVDDANGWTLGELGPLEPTAPVVHVSWFEADAFARAHGARLPTELEWELAATWDPATGEQRLLPWGSDPVSRAYANVDHQGCGPAPVGTFPAGAAAAGPVAMIGDVWEWTDTPFAGYPGFVSYPYREYSEQFFGGGYRVLRGGSWATRARVASATFRNWDLPQRRQIFSGLRLAKDVR
jgi:gamma-glutamyl hercynylcysteine S-oxide synthase